MSFDLAASLPRAMFPIRSMSSPRDCLSRLGLAYTFGRMPFSVSFSFSINSMALSSSVPMVGCFD